jgi:multiple sugar transport system permease protein
VAAPAARRSRRATGAARYLLGTPLALFLAAFTLFPLGLGLWISLTDRSVLRRDPGFVGLANYGDIIGQARFWQAISFTFRFTVITTVAILTLGFLLAVLAQRHFPGKRVLLTTLLLPIMVAPALMGIMFRLSLNSSTGIVPALLAALGLDVALFDPVRIVPLLMVLEVVQWTPFAFLIIYAGLQALPTEVFEAAEVDGATRWQSVRHLTLPLMTPVLFSAGFLRAVDALRTFDVIYVLTGGGPGTISETATIYIYKKAFVEGAFGLASASAVLLLLILLPLVPIVIRRVVTPPGTDR